jgi:hypothetical protein
MLGSTLPLRIASGQEVILLPYTPDRGETAEPWRVRPIVRDDAIDAAPSAPHAPRSTTSSGMRGRLIDILV